MSADHARRERRDTAIGLALLIGGSLGALLASGMIGYLVLVSLDLPSVAQVWVGVWR